MSSTALEAGEAGESRGRAGTFTAVLDDFLGAVASRLEWKVADWTHKLNDVAAGEVAGGGPGRLVDEGLDAAAEAGNTAVAAGAEGVKAGMHGKNPLRGAIKGVWKSGSPAVKAAMVGAAVLAIVLVLLSPVLATVLLVIWLIVAASRRRRPEKKQ